ncbi:MAG: anaerobic ribonucleoside-triphosphate reductase [Tenericutes bacterium]|nr:anaerobic ribonucleoside-triphosphate reductase [Mycoplasmatota bacterium]
MKQVIKRNGKKVKFDKEKIINAIEKAFLEVDGEVVDKSHQKAKEIAEYIESQDKSLSVEEIQDIVEDKLMASNRKDVARAYVRYRYKKEVLRKENTTDKSVFELLSGTSEYWNNENANKNAKSVTTQRDYLAGITSTDITRRFLLDKDIVEAHDAGIIHFHDADYFAQNVLHNCELINLNDMLQNGTVVNGVMIEKPHRLITAATIATQIILAVTSSSYGGCTVSLTHLAPFVRDSYNKYYKKYIDNGIDEETAKKLSDIDTKKEIADAVQTFNYQVNSMTNTNGQAPFLSVCMYLGETDEYKEELAMLIEEFLKQRMLGFKNEKGVYVTPAFPKLLYVLEEDNIHPDSKYYYLTELAAKCTAKRMVPDYISEKVMLANKIDAKGEGNCYPCMGCRSFLTPDRFQTNLSNAKDYVEGKSKYYGRFNQGVVTINLPDIALSSNKDMDKFWKIFDERLELCHRALQARYKRLSMGISDIAPILWQYGALARLEKGESIDKLLKNGYSTLSLGYAGLYECVKYMTGYSHTGEGKEFGLAVMQHLNDACNKWKKEENIDYSVYGTPIESTTYKFATKLKERFGKDIFVEMDGADRDYITNSYHVPVFEKINPFEKLSLESEFQKLSPGGAISYIECSDLTNNVGAILQVIDFIYNNIMYAELNTKSDYCQVCGYDGEIKIIDKDGKLDWQCPNCGNTDHSKMNVARRTCGLTI